MTNTHPDEMPCRRAVVIAAVLCAALVAPAAAEARSTAGTSCSAKADVCEGNCTVRLRHSPELNGCRSRLQSTEGGVPQGRHLATVAVGSRRATYPALSAQRTLAPIK